MRAHPLPWIGSKELLLNDTYPSCAYSIRAFLPVESFWIFHVRAIGGEDFLTGIAEERDLAASLWSDWATESRPWFLPNSGVTDRLLSDLTGFRKRLMGASLLIVLLVWVNCLIHDFDSFQSFEDRPKSIANKCIRWASRSHINMLHAFWSM